MILGCDYSTKFVNLGWFNQGWHYPRTKVAEDLGEFLYDLKLLLPDPWEDGHLYIERPWSGYNQWTGMQMQRVATIVDVVATQAGYETHWVAIATWRSKLFGKGKYTTKLAKSLAISYAREKCGITEGIDDNTADALCLALYGESCAPE